MCVRNYNSDANNKDVITVDYMVTGGRQSETFHLLIVKNNLRFENEFEMSLTSKEKLHSNVVLKDKKKHCLHPKLKVSRL